MKDVPMALKNDFELIKVIQMLIKKIVNYFLSRRGYRKKKLFIYYNAQFDKIDLFIFNNEIYY